MQPVIQTTPWFLFLVLFSYGWIISLAHFLNIDCCYVVRSEGSIYNNLIIESSLNSVWVFFFEIGSMVNFSVLMKGDIYITSFRICPGIVMVVCMH